MLGRASAWFLVSKFGPPAFSEPSRALRARDSLQPQEGGEGAAGEKKIATIRSFANVLLF